MYLTGLNSLFDEKSWGTDAWNFPNSIYKVQNNWISRGTVSNYDVDYLQLELPYSGDYKLTISNDPSNNWGDGWGIGTISATIVNNFGATQANLTTNAYHTLDGVLYFSYKATYLSNEFYLKIDGTNTAHYVVKLEFNSSYQPPIYTNPVYTGTAKSETFISSANNDTIDGGSGIDTVVFDGKTSNYVFTKTSSGFTLKNITGTNETDYISNIERLKFSDQLIALDISDNGAHAGEVAKILGAVFGASSVTNKEYVGIGIYYRDSGMSYEDLAALAVNATGKTSHTEIVELLWKNIIGTPIPDQEKAYYGGLLDNGMSIGALVTLAADTQQNLSNINLIGHVESGLAYTAFHG